MPESINENTSEKSATCQGCKASATEEDCNRTVCGRCSKTFGCDTSADGECSLAQGCGSIAIGNCSHAEGSNTRAAENNSHAEGCSTRAFGSCSHAEGSSTMAYADTSHTEGLSTRARGYYAHAEGNSSEANGESSHAQGVGTKADGYAAFSQGGYTTARGNYSHAEGYGSTSNGIEAHAEGYYTNANGSIAHAEGYYTNANANYSHAEGYYSLTEGYSAHAEGYYTNARAPYSHSEGYYTDTKAFSGSHIMGIYGDADTPYSWFLAGGSSSERALAAKILYTGDAYIRNAWNAGGAGYAEMYRSIGSQPIAPGYFVTLQGECASIANETDEFILGVTSAISGFAANSDGLNPGVRYLTGVWNEIQYENVAIPEKTDKEGAVVEPAQIVKQPIMKAQVQTSSLAAYGGGNTDCCVIILGQVLVQDDGTCVANGFCSPNKDGIATASAKGYRVMGRISDNQILIFFR